jgi:hypothetical protein
MARASVGRSGSPRWMPAARVRMRAGARSRVRCACSSARACAACMCVEGLVVSAPLVTPLLGTHEAGQVVAWRGGAAFPQGERLGPRPACSAVNASARAALSLLSRGAGTVDHALLAAPWRTTGDKGTGRLGHCLEVLQGGTSRRRARRAHLLRVTHAAAPLQANLWSERRVTARSPRWRGRCTNSRPSPRRGSELQNPTVCVGGSKAGRMKNYAVLSLGVMTHCRVDEPFRGEGRIGSAKARYCSQPLPVPRAIAHDIDTEPGLDVLNPRRPTPAKQYIVHRCRVD